ncbi:MAG TPA: hypothetical protein VH761_17730, partial [Ilumatobacteraceae bacterium]
SPDTELPRRARATIAAMPDCALLNSVGIFPPSTKVATAFQVVTDGSLLTQKVFVYATADDASRAMDVIDDALFATCWFNLFDRVAPLVSPDKLMISEAWSVPHVYGPLEPFEIAPHGDRQVIIGQHMTVSRVTGSVDRYFVNAFVQVGRTITWINPRFVVPNNTTTSDPAERSVGINEAIAAATSAVQNASGS